MSPNSFLLELFHLLFLTPLSETPPPSRVCEVTVAPVTS